MSDPLDRFSSQAIDVLKIAQAEARSRHHPYIETEHLLFGLLALRASRANDLLDAIDVDVEALRERIAEALAPPEPETSREPELGKSAERMLQLAFRELQITGHSVIGTEHLLAGLVGIDHRASSRILAEADVTQDKIDRHLQGPDMLEPLPMRISPVFIAIVLVTVLSGYLASRPEIDPRWTVFPFVTGGWLLSLCLHEFAHAIVAFRCGDRRVAHRGYLTLNPLKYTDVVWSLILPVLYMIAGGIALPGGAVIINPFAIRKRWQRSLVAAAGPLASVLFTMVLIVIFVLQPAAGDPVRAFGLRSALALLISIEAGSLLLNLLPVPGLDGFGILAPYLPDPVRAKAAGVRRYGLWVVFILLTLPVFNQAFWGVVDGALGIAGVDPELMIFGFYLFQFWRG